MAQPFAAPKFDEIKHVLVSRRRGIEIRRCIWPSEPYSDTSTVLHLRCRKIPTGLEASDIGPSEWLFSAQCGHYRVWASGRSVVGLPILSCLAERIACRM